MTKLYEILGIPFGFVISLFYALSGNYLLSIFCLMLLVKICLLPSAISQQKAQANQARMQPKLRKIKEKFAGDNQKIQQETQALYQREGVSAMGGGCLPMIIQFPIMIGLYQVNYHPFSMVLRIPTEVVTALKDAVVPIIGEAATKTGAFRMELYALQHFNDIKGGVAGLTPDLIEKIELFISKFTVFGFDLAQKPEFKSFDKYWIIPIVSGILALAMSVYSLIRQKQTNPDMAKNPSMGCMMLFSPAMQIYFAFLFPISVGIYIIMSTAVSFLQMVILNFTHNSKKVLTKLMVEETVYRRSREENIKKARDM